METLTEHDTTPTNQSLTFQEQTQRFGVLSPLQFHRVQQILLNPVSIGGSDQQSPILVIKPFQLIQKIKRILKQNGMPVRAVKMNGSTAGYVLQEAKKGENTNETFEYTPHSSNLLRDNDFSVENCDSNSDSSTSPCSYLSESEIDFASGTESDTDNITQTLSELPLEDNNNNNNNSQTNNSYTTREFTPTDLDIIFEVDLNSHVDYQNVKYSVLQVLFEFYPPHLKNSLSLSSLETAYIPRKKKIWQETGDKWSFLSLHNSEGKNIDLKFITRIKRPYEFSVDSFHIYLDVLCDYLSDEYTPSNIDTTSIPYGLQITVETKYSDLQDALTHLNNKIIETNRPEEIRGGGLLKYCYLLIHGFDTASMERQYILERYMCSRFFIDFHIRSPEYQQKILSYLLVHFPGATCPQTADAYLEVVRVINFLRTLQTVAKRSAICLGKEDLNIALTIIDLIVNQYTQPQVVTYSYFPYFTIPQQFLPKSNSFSEEKPVVEKSKVYVEDRKPFVPKSHNFIEESKSYKPNEPDAKTENRSRNTLERRPSQEENIFQNQLPMYYNFFPFYAMPNVRPLFFTPTNSVHKPFLFNQQTQQQDTFKSKQKSN